jgi:hypothetical protein
VSVEWAYSIIPSGNKYLTNVGTVLCEVDIKYLLKCSPGITAWRREDRGEWKAWTP